jgi:integrase
MQRVLSAFSKEGKPPFSLRGLRIPERDKLQMKIHSRKTVSYDWEDAVRISQFMRTGKLKFRERYAVMILLGSASGLRPEELLALRIDDIDLRASSFRVDEALDRKNVVGPCKNAAAYRTVLLLDAEGQTAMRALKGFLAGNKVPSNALVFPNKDGGPLDVSMVLKYCLHPAAEALGLPKAGMRALRRGCNRRWETSGVSPAIIRQQMGHSDARMTTLYTGEIPLRDVREAFSRVQDKAKNPLLENNGKWEAA